VSPSSEWNVTPFIECPNCGRHLSLRVERCPDCQELIDEEYALYSALHVIVITQACSFANSIKYLDLIAIFVLGISVYVYLLNVVWLFLLVPITSAVPLVFIVLWFSRFGRLRFAEDDFQKALREMRASLVLWMGILIVQLIALATLWSPPTY
jgi:hypothetical protein